MADASAGDVAKQIGDLAAATNIAWTLLCAFLVMFMQAGFALVETGLCRKKNAAHTMAMNFLVYAIGILGFWAVGFGIQMGGVGAMETFGGDETLSQEFTLLIGGKPWGLFGTEGFFLTAASYTPAVATMFLFQMVFMDTTATIPTGAMALSRAMGWAKMPLARRSEHRAPVLSPRARIRAGSGPTPRAKGPPYRTQESRLQQTWAKPGRTGGRGGFLERLGRDSFPAPKTSRGH